MSDELVGAWPDASPTPAERVAAYLLLYLEDYDARVCSGQRDGEAFPATYEETYAVQAHAAAAWRAVRHFAVWRGLSLVAVKEARNRFRGPRDAQDYLWTPRGLPDRLLLELGRAVERAVGDFNPWI